MSNLQALRQRLPAAITLALRLQDERDGAFLRALYVSRRWAEVSAAPGLSDAQRLAFLHSQAELQQQHYTRHYPDADFFIIEQQGQPAGRLCLLLGADEARIVDIALLPEWQATGNGSALIQAVLALTDARAQACCLSVDIMNPAQRLYARLGFVTCGQQGPYLQMRRAVGNHDQHRQE